MVYALVCLRVILGTMLPSGLESWYGEQWPAWSDGGERWELRYIGQWWPSNRQVEVAGRWYTIGGYGGAIVHAPSGTIRQFRGIWPMPSDCRASYQIRLGLAFR